MSRKMNANVGIFASPKQHSLFPMTIPCPNVSKEDYHIFYQHERRLFAFLLVVLYREVVQSTLVVGFLLWLEREGYTSKNLVKTIVDSLSFDLINLVIDEVVICLKCIEEKGNKLFEGSSNKDEIELLEHLLDRKRICLRDLHKNRDCIFNEVSCIAKDVCGKAFEDILHQFKRCGTSSTMASPMKATASGVGVKGSNYLGSIVPFSSYDFNKRVGLYPESGFVAQQNKSIVANGGMLNPTIDLGKKLKNTPLKLPLIITEQEHEVSPEDRTIFLTFSKGYPISESEVRDYFTSYFGDFIEAVYMHDAGQDGQALYARIVACSSSMVKAIVERDGPHGKSKYNINGKHVWARKYVKKKHVKMPPTESATSSEVITPPQP